MHGLKFAIMSTALMTASAHAQDLGDRSETTRNGMFVGARMTLSLSSRTAARPRTMFAFAPTQLRQSVGGPRQMRIGEGIALNFRGREAPALTVGNNVDPQGKLGISTVGWIAIGVGVVATAGAIAFLRMMEEAEENSG